MPRFLRLNCSNTDRDISSASLRLQCVIHGLLLILLGRGINGLTITDLSSLIIPGTESHNTDPPR